MENPASGALEELAPSDPSTVPAEERAVVSTHVLVEQDKVEELRRLSKRTRIAQSEYLREAVDDLLLKYHRIDRDGPDAAPTAEATAEAVE